MDLIYLCFPNNPTGGIITKDALTKWVNYAHDNKSLILFDAAYEAFIRDDVIPHSIYEIGRCQRCSRRVQKFLKNSGIYRNSMCVYRGSQDL